MESKIFDKDTLLDLVVNFIPLGIILFFIAAFTLYAPWGFDVRGFAPMMVIMVTMFIALAVLTYISGKAIAGDEKTKPVYPQGQAGLKGAKTVHELEDELEADERGTPVDTEPGVDADTEPATEADTDTETAVDADTETDAKQPAGGDDDHSDASK